MKAVSVKSLSKYFLLFFSVAHTTLNIKALRYSILILYVTSYEWLVVLCIVWSLIRQGFECAFISKQKIRIEEEIENKREKLSNYKLMGN